MTSETGTLIVIVAPSGTGKSTLIKRLLQEVPRLEWSVSCTTRPIRDGEVDGVNYHFLEVDDFKQKIDQGDFIEWAQVHSNFYGTSKSFVDQGIKENKSLLFDLDVQGADQVKKLYGSTANIIFIAPPSVEELQKRLLNRGTDSHATIEERLKNAESELTRKNDYDYLVINDDLDKAYQHLKSIVEPLVG